MTYSLFIIFSASMILLIQCANNIESEKRGNISRIQISERENGYSNFNSTIIKDSVSLYNFIQVVENQDSWSNKDIFIQNMSDTKLDLIKMNLLLFRHTEVSGSIKLTLEKPYSSNELITIRINRSSPSIRTNDMAYYCFA